MNSTCRYCTTNTFNFNDSSDIAAPDKSNSSWGENNIFTMVLLYPDAGGPRPEWINNPPTKWHVLVRVSITWRAAVQVKADVSACILVVCDDAAPGLPSIHLSAPPACCLSLSSLYSLRRTKRGRRRSDNVGLTDRFNLNLLYLLTRSDRGGKPIGHSQNCQMTTSVQMGEGT